MALVKHTSKASLRRTLAGLLLGLLAIRPALAADALQVEIADYRAYLTEEHPVRQGMRKFAELVNAGSAGGIQVRVRTDALPGSPARQIEALREGGAGVPALMLVATTGLAKKLPALGVFDLPFLVRDGREADALLEGRFGGVLLERLGSTGLVGLSWWENGFRQITSSGRAIRQAGDLRGLKIRVIAEPAFADTFRALGADPLPLPFDALYEALKAKRVDAQDNFYAQILAGRLQEVQSSLTITNHSYSPLVLVANQSFWRALAPQQRALLQAAALEAARFQRGANRREEETARTRLAAAGMQVQPLDPVALRTMEALTQPVRAQYLDAIANSDAGLVTLYRTEIDKQRQKGEHSTKD